MIGTHPYWLDILLLSLFALAFVAISYVIGVLFFNIPSEQKYRKAFFNTIAGALAIIDIYSCLVTGFKTVNTCSLVLLAYLAFQNKEFFHFKNIEIKCLIPYLYIVPVVFILYSLYILPDSMMQDTRYYAKVTYNLYDQGIENVYHFYNNYEKKFNGITPYHYTEFWFASFFKVLTNSLSYFSVVYFSYPLLISLLSFGVISMSKRNKPLIFSVFICLSLFPLGRYLTFFNVGWEIINSFWMRPNLITYYLLFALLYNSVSDKNMRLFYVFLAIGMTFSFVIAPPLFVAAAGLNLFHLLTKKITLKEALLNMSPALVCLILMSALFNFFGPETNLTLQVKFTKLVSESLKMWKGIVGVGTKIIIEATLIPAGLWLYNKVKKEPKEEQTFILFVLFLVFIGVGMFQLLNQLDNAYQFPYFAYVGVGFLFIVLVFKLVDLIQNKIVNVGTYILVSVICLFFFQQHFAFGNVNKTFEKACFDYEHVSDQWVKNVKQYLTEHPDARGGFIWTEETIKNSPSKNRHCVTVQIGNHLNFITDKNCNLPCISCRDLMLYDYTEENKEVFEKQLLWLDAFPKYTKDCEPENYLIRKELDFFICPLDYPVKNLSFGVIPDSTKKLKLVYRNTK
ncbi:MAG: hypothetical protein ACXVPN_07670 [Bacteroidia bacterium]